MDLLCCLCLVWTIQLIDIGQAHEIQGAGTKSFLRTGVGRGAAITIQIQFQCTPGLNLNCFRVKIRSEYSSAGRQHVIKYQLSITDLTQAKKPASIALRVVTEPVNDHTAVDQYLDIEPFAIVAAVEP